MTSPARQKSSLYLLAIKIHRIIWMEGVGSEVWRFRPLESSGSHEVSWKIGLFSRGWARCDPCCWICSFPSCSSTRCAASEQNGCGLATCIMHGFIREEHLDREPKKNLAVFASMFMKICTWSKPTVVIFSVAVTYRLLF